MPFKKPERRTRASGEPAGDDEAERRRLWLVGLAVTLLLVVGGLIFAVQGERAERRDRCEIEALGRLQDPARVCR